MTSALPHAFRLLCALFVSAVAFGIAGPSPAYACSLCSCSVSTTSVNFGSYDPTTAAPDDTTGTVTVNCTGLVALFGSVDITASAGASGNAAQRTMRQGSNSIDYNLYVDSARTIIFGNGSSGTQKITAPLNGLLIFGQSAAFYGRMRARQWARAGTYSDTIVITITY